MRSSAYGMNFTGLPEPERALLGGPLEGAPDVELSWRWATAVNDKMLERDGEAIMMFRRSHGAAMCRDPLRIEFHLPGPAGDQIAHPLLTTPAAVLARWLGNVTLHGGAFARSNGSWIVLAEKEGGKSSTMAGLALRGLEVLTDDLVVVDPAGELLAGPRCVDLRSEPAARLAVGTDLGTVSRARHRFVVAPPTPRTPLAGVVLLGWGGETAVDVQQIDLVDRLPHLHAHELGPFGRQDPVGLLSLACLPMFRLLRPRTWDSFDPCLDALVSLSS